ncbi:hypothetical protein EGW08_007517 [Elysia chlorotica]|uniref:Uncharacterized protein n=1 Tax=Elysia chlorotica TaxID=188477 RepID=A0A3S1BN78_ELYCH|nr:hypothetical protein EGW08_007517 [Elysia chlorotica]
MANSIDCVSLQNLPLAKGNLFQKRKIGFKPFQKLDRIAENCSKLLKEQKQFMFECKQKGRIPVSPRNNWNLIDVIGRSEVDEKSKLNKSTGNKPVELFGNENHESHTEQELVNLRCSNQTPQEINMCGKTGCNVTNKSIANTTRKTGLLKKDKSIRSISHQGFSFHGSDLTTKNTPTSKKRNNRRRRRKKSKSCEPFLNENVCLEQSKEFLRIVSPNEKGSDAQNGDEILSNPIGDSVENCGQHVSENAGGCATPSSNRFIEMGDKNCRLVPKSVSNESAQRV